MARLDNNGWWRCEKCGHKLFFVKDFGYGADGYTIQIKCHSCKSIQEIIL